jgi:hypothetical protein
VVASGAPHQEHVGFGSRPTVVLADELVNGIPAVFVVGRGHQFDRRFGDHLAIEVAHQVGGAVIGHHPASDVEFGNAVVVEVEAVARPGPGADFDALGVAGIVEGSIAVVMVEGVSFDVVAVGLAE